MRPRLIGEGNLATIMQMHASGENYRQIADKVGLGHMTVYYAIKGRKPARPARSEHPDRITVMSAHNGGCSTTSGMMPVTLPRLRCLEAANDNRPPVTEMAVAA